MPYNINYNFDSVLRQDHDMTTKVRIRQHRLRTQPSQFYFLINLISLTHFHNLFKTEIICQFIKSF